MVKKSLDIIVSKIDIEPTEKIKSVKVLGDKNEHDERGYS